jgi:hypothetical protein
VIGSVAAVVGTGFDVGLDEAALHDSNEGLTSRCVRVGSGCGRNPLFRCAGHNEGMVENGAARGLNCVLTLIFGASMSIKLLDFDLKGRPGDNLVGDRPPTADLRKFCPRIGLTTRRLPQEGPDWEL